jgi:5-methylcytosine-specific restriction endonuclease McrA
MRAPQPSALLRKVLVLDLNWVPVSLVTTRKALSLLFAADPRAVWVKPDDLSTHGTSSVWAVRRAGVGGGGGGGADAHNIRTPRLAVRAPTVIVLARSVATSAAGRGAPGFSRTGVLRRDGRRCAYCGGAAETVDHVVPKALGGTSSWRNCVACCRPCNARKGKKPLDGCSMRLRPGVRLDEPCGTHWGGWRRAQLERHWADLLASTSRAVQ